MLINYSLSSPARERLQCVQWSQKWEHFRTLRSEIFRGNSKIHTTDYWEWRKHWTEEDSGHRGLWLLTFSQKSDINCNNYDSISYNSYLLSYSCDFHNSDFFSSKIWLFLKKKKKKWLFPSFFKFFSSKIRFYSFVWTRNLYVFYFSLFSKVFYVPMCQNKIHLKKKKKSDFSSLKNDFFFPQNLTFFSPQKNLILYLCIHTPCMSCTLVYFPKCFIWLWVKIKQELSDFFPKKSLLLYFSQFWLKTQRKIK